MSAGFPERLREARDQRGLSQAQLAEAAGLPVTSISHFEGGARKPSFDNLRALAKALQVSADYLLGLADSPEKAFTTDSLYRHGQNLTTKNRDLAEKILKLLSERDTKEKG